MAEGGGGGGGQVGEGGVQDIASGLHFTGGGGGGGS